MTGTIKAVSPTWAFVTPDDGSKEPFIPMSIVVALALTVGMRISFEVYPGDKGPRARNVQIIEVAS